jgi:hypothetical protein
MSSRPHGESVQRIKDLVVSLPKNSGINKDAIIANVGTAASSTLRASSRRRRTACCELQQPGMSDVSAADYQNRIGQERG